MKESEGIDKEDEVKGGPAEGHSTMPPSSSHQAAEAGQQGEVAEDD